VKKEIKLTNLPLTSDIV